MELVIFIAVLICLYFFGEWAIRQSDESKRARQAIRTETIRVKNNRRLTKTDCFVYLIRIDKYKGKPYETSYLKIGIGVEDRVRLQLKEEGSTLISLYLFRIRDDAFKVEQKVLKSWNTKVLGEITTDNKRLGTEYIHYSEKNLKKALEILSNSIGTDSFLDDVGGVLKQDGSSSQKPAILDRTLVYLLLNDRERLIKVGMGTFDRPDNLKGKDWEIVRFCHFSDREAARYAESKVLAYWRDELGMKAPERAKSLLKSGHTETVESSVGINKAWAIITSCPKYIPQILENEHQILEEYENFFERGKLLINDEVLWQQVRASWYGVIDSKILQQMRNIDTEVNSRQKVTALKSEIRRFAKEFQDFMNQNHAIIERAKSAKSWDVTFDDSKKPKSRVRAAPSAPLNDSKGAENDEIKRFWDQVEKQEECWIWRGTKNPNGYGLVIFGNRQQPAHRVAWLLKYGECAPEIFLENKCGAKPCVRTEHWEIGVRRRSKPGEVRISPFVCPTPDCGKPSVTMTMVGLCDSCRQRAKRERRKLRKEED